MEHCYDREFYGTAISFVAGVAVRARFRKWLVAGQARKQRPGMCGKPDALAAGVDAALALPGGPSGALGSRRGAGLGAARAQRAAHRALGRPGTPGFSWDARRRLGGGRPQPQVQAGPARLPSFLSPHSQKQMKIKASQMVFMMIF